MPLLKRIIAHYVRVDPDNWLQPEDLEREGLCCKEIAGQIKRHIDGFKSVSIETESEPRCEFCGSYWTEDSDRFNGGCCDKDMEHEPPEE